MSFEYIWGVLTTQERPPTGEMFSVLTGEYKFFPFSHDGQILTFDEHIWGKAQDRMTHNILWPSETQIEKFILESRNTNLKLIIAFSDDEYALTIKQGETVKIYKISEHLHEPFLKNFNEYGYDVVDSSGLSALTNIGYKLEDLGPIKNIKVNKYGLISEANEARNFADIASRKASEHAPFFPVNLWGNISN